jgi:uncharacterized protein YegP (UPF0339 family)
MNRPAITIGRYRDAAGLWRWRAKAANGRIVADSGQGYRRRVDMERALCLLAEHLPASTILARSQATTALSADSSERTRLDEAVRVFVAGLDAEGGDA